MLLRYNISPDDIVAFNMHLIKTIPAMRRSALWMKWRMIVPLGVIIILLSFYYSDPLMAVLGVLFLILAHVRYTRRIQQYYMKQATEGPNKEILGQAEMEITPDALIGRSHNIESKIKWERVDRIETDEDRTYIFLGERIGIILPRTSVTEGDCDAFLREVNNKMLSASP
jgi:TRAP-type uncharacterized transport system fused permease subunit